MDIYERLIEAGGGYRVADRIDIIENGRIRSLIPDCMNDELAGWRCFMEQEQDREIEIVGNDTPPDESEEYLINQLFAKVDGNSLKICVEWMENDRVSFITTTAPFTVFWQGEDKHSLLGNPTAESKESLGD